MLDIQTILNALSTLASFAAVFVVIYQVKRTIQWNDDRKIEEDFNLVRTQASAIDAWAAIATAQCGTTDKAENERVVIIRNYSPNPIRDVHLIVSWGNVEGKTEKIPSLAKGLQILPQGTWTVKRADEKDRVTWNLPNRLPEQYESSFTPLFTVNDDHPSSYFKVIKISYIDINGNKWEKIYADKEAGSCMKLNLLESSRADFQKFIADR